MKKNIFALILCSLSMIHGTLCTDSIEDTLYLLGLRGYKGTVYLALSATCFAAALWMAKETVRDTGLAYLSAKKRLQAFEQENMVEAEKEYGIEYSSFERKVAKALQLLYILPEEYVREIAAAGITVLLCYMGKSLFKQSTVDCVSIYYRG